MIQRGSLGNCEDGICGLPSHETIQGTDAHRSVRNFICSERKGQSKVTINYMF